MSSTGLTTNGNIATGAASLADSTDFAADPASSTFFAADLKKYGDLKNMLESNKDQLKLEAMKRIIGMIAKGKDASELFPSVVKNVVSKNIEIKKLVYAYLIRYAEEQQDLALLSISTFQRALKDPNQLIRANALRVLSSIRVPVIVPIMMLAIRDCSSDMSPYVRKSAALAIPKLYSLDDEQKEQLVEVIDKLLGDKTTLVIGSAVCAFDEVCPERDDLIHKNYRRLCQILMDIEEWGQVSIINTLTRYARTQFADPNGGEEGEEKNGGEKFYEDDDEDVKPVSKKPTVDNDLRLLLRSVKPLLQSRNSAVVMAVIQLYVHVAPRTEMTANIKPMIRLLRSHREIQSVVLSNIATLAAKPEQKALLVPHLKAFFVRSSDPTHIKLQKLEILTNLASEGTIGIILREFQAYISSSDRELIASTIQAIGRCAMTISEVTETCLNGLVNLLSNRDDNVVGESVCVIRKLLQLNPTAHKDIIKHLAKLVETVQVPMAKASILWLIGEYCEQVPTIAPDVLRLAVKTFPKEENIVKLQILNLAAKLLTVNPQQTSLLAVYAFNLAKYDVSYDIRDRSRFLKALVMPGHIGSGDDGIDGSTFSSMAHQILMATKPAPVLESRFKERMEFQMGTLSHFLNIRTSGYQDLPDFPPESLPSSVRDVALPPEPERKQSPTKTNRILSPSKTKKADKFYSDEEQSEEEEDEDEDTDEEDEEDSDESNTDESEEEGSDEEGDQKKQSGKVQKVNGEPKQGKYDEQDESGEDETSESEEDDETSDEESSMSEDEKKKVDTKPKVSIATAPKPAVDTNSPNPVKKVPEKTVPTQKVPEKQRESSKVQAVDLLLDFDGDMSSSAPLMSAMQPLSHPALSSSGKSQSTTTVTLPPVYVPTKSYEVLSASSNGGFGVSYRYPRRPFMFSGKMVAIEFMFDNTSDQIFSNIRVVRKKLPGRVEAQDFHEIGTLEGGKVAHATMGVDFADTTQSISIVVGYGDNEYEVTLKPRMGELLRPIAMSRSEFDKNKSSLSGLNENQSSVDVPVKLQTEAGLTNAVLEVANVAPIAVKDETADVESSKTLRFAGQTLSSGSPVMVTTVLRGSKASVIVNCEKAMVGSLVLQEIKDFLAKFR